MLPGSFELSRGWAGVCRPLGQKSGLECPGLVLGPAHIQTILTPQMSDLNFGRENKSSACVTVCAHSRGGDDPDELLSVPDMSGSGSHRYRGEVNAIFAFTTPMRSQLSSGVLAV